MPIRRDATNNNNMRPRAGHALVTGGAQRIGRAISLALARAGYGVVVHARRDEDPARKFLRDIEALGVPAHLVTAELSEPDAAATLVKTATDTAGPLSLLVNNASAFELDAFGTIEAAAWDRAFAVNLRAPVLLAQAFAAQVGARGRARAIKDPSIVNVTDQRSLKPVPRQFSYTLTKIALHHATTMLAQALAPRIRVNAVAPGPTLPSPRQDRSEFARQAAAVPLGRGPRPEDIAAAVVYLAGATKVTGTTIPIDGGQHIAWETPDVAGIEE